MSSQWLPITEYSTKYKVSVSTLRRRIKANDIRFVFEDGKYFIADEPIVVSNPVQPHRPSLNSVMSPSPEKLEKRLQRHAQSDEPILTAANRLLSDLKKAYTTILHEKEEQICELKAELADLKTLVKVLESENSRLQKHINPLNTHI
jgi:hypothetical protein